MRLQTGQNYEMKKLRLTKGINLSVFNYALRHEGAWRTKAQLSAFLTSPIDKLAICFNRGKLLENPLAKMKCGPQSWSRRCGE
jgi:hypothetical protein